VTTEQAWYIGQRAESLTVVYLTRRSDLIVTPQPKAYGLSFLVEISKLGSRSGRIFGIQIEATVNNAKAIENDNKSFEIKQDLPSTDSISELPFPVCLLFWTLNNDQAYYKWVLEPVIETQNNPKLLFNQSQVFQKLTNKEINKIVSTVNNWYDSRSLGKL
jgi:Domain of unknown function (DUF4365)